MKFENLNMNASKSVMLSEKENTKSFKDNVMSDLR